MQRRQTAELWLAVLRVLTRTSVQPNQHLRHHAIQALHGCGHFDRKAASEAQRAATNVMCGLPGVLAFPSQSLCKPLGAGR